MQSLKYKGAFYVKANPGYVGGDLLTRYKEGDGVVFVRGPHKGKKGKIEKVRPLPRGSSREVAFDVIVDGNKVNAFEIDIKPST